MMKEEVSMDGAFLAKSDTRKRRDTHVFPPCPYCKKTNYPK